MLSSLSTRLAMISAARKLRSSNAGLVVRMSAELEFPPGKWPPEGLPEAVSSVDGLRWLGRVGDRMIVESPAAPFDVYSPSTASGWVIISSPPLELTYGGLDHLDDVGAWLEALVSLLIGSVGEPVRSRRVVQADLAGWTLDWGSAGPPDGAEVMGATVSFGRTTIRIEAAGGLGRPGRVLAETLVRAVAASEVQRGIWRG